MIGGVQRSAYAIIMALVLIMRLLSTPIQTAPLVEYVPCSFYIRCKIEFFQCRRAEQVSGVTLPCVEVYKECGDSCDMQFNFHDSRFY